MILRSTVGVTILLFTAGLLRAQEASTILQQTNPASLKWYQINTPNFQFLYPAGFEKQAQRMANTLEHIREPEAASMGVKPKRIPIILQNQSSVSNGFVTLAPRRAEFFGMPTQDYNFTGNNDWLNLLASHEYRHIVQYQRSITGFDKVIYYLFGQQALSAMSNAAAPMWFWEGDAVATETAFTHSGRGRIPNFNLLLRTNLLEGRVFNYNKQYLRSYKNNISDHYVLGYHMISYLRMKTGDPAIWEKIARRAWNVPFIPLRFSSSIKAEAGLYVKDLYKEMAGELINRWKKELQDLPITSFERVNQRNGNAYTDYKYPQVLEDGSVVAQKSGIGDIETLVVFRNGMEEKKYVQGQMNSSGMMSAARSAVVWNEFRFDRRWQVRTYSVIKLYDLKSNSSAVLSSNTRYASAALSPDGDQVATVETGTNYLTRLVILNAHDGLIMKEFSNPGNDFISMPHWSSDGRTLVALKTNRTGKTISLFTAADGSSVDLLPFTAENMGYPVPFGKYVLYNSPYSGIDNIYAFDSSTGKRYQVTSSRYGAYNSTVTADGKSIYYNDQTRDGLDIVRIPFDPASWKPLEEVRVPESGLSQNLVKQEGHPGLLDSIPAHQYAATRYHRASGMINTHSWGTYFANTYTQAQFGLYSQDILSTTSINAGYLYDINEKTGSLQAGISYQGFYPILDFQVYHGNRQTTTSVGTSNVKFDWKETGSSFGLRLPLNLTRSKYYSQLEIGNYFSATQIRSFQNVVTEGNTVVSQGDQRYVPIDITVNNMVQHVDYMLPYQLNNGTLLSNYFYITYIHSLKQSRRDFNPKFGQYLYFEDYSTPYGGNFNGNLWVIRGITYFPGLFKHHSLYFRGGYQNSLSSYELDTYSFRSRVFKPRGYSYPYDHTFGSFSGNYQLPIWYPDVAIGPVLNVQRIMTNFFCDYGQSKVINYFYDFANNRVYTSKPTLNYLSTGLEVTFDINVLRLLQQIELGFRISHINANAYNNSGLVYEFLIGNIPF